MFQAAWRALEQFFSPEFRMVFLKAIGLTLALFAAVWFALQQLVAAMAPYPYPWMETVAGFIAGAGLLIGMAFLIGPIAALFAGLFLDQVAEAVETRYYPSDPAGRELPAFEGFLIALKFFATLVLVNLVALLFLLVPGVNVIAFLAGNGYLLGREYFELAGLRHMTYDEVKALRRQHRGEVFVAGLTLAVMASVPFVSLFLPLFATAFMVHISRDIRVRRQPAPQRA